MNRFLISLALLAVTTGLPISSAATVETPNLEGPELELYGLVQEIESVLPQSWRIVESDIGRVPIGWTGPENGLYVMVEDTSTRFFHPNGFHYYSFYRIWLMPSQWEGEMRHTPYVSDSAPAFLLGLNNRYVALYHTAGGNVWEDGPGEMVSLLGLDRIRYTDLMRRVVDMEMEERLVVECADEAEGREESENVGFEMNPYRIVGLSGAGPSLYLEYVFGTYEDAEGATLEDLTERLAGNVFERFPEVESLYLRRCTADTFTDTIVNRD